MDWQYQARQSGSTAECVLDWENEVRIWLYAALGRLRFHPMVGGSLTEVIENILGYGDGVNRDRPPFNAWSGQRGVSEIWHMIQLIRSRASQVSNNPQSHAWFELGLLLGDDLPVPAFDDIRKNRFATAINIVGVKPSFLTDLPELENKHVVVVGMVPSNADVPHW